MQNNLTHAQKRYIFNPPNNMSKTPIYDSVWQSKGSLDLFPKRNVKTESWSLGGFIRIIIGSTAAIGALMLFKRLRISVNKFPAKM